MIQLIYKVAFGLYIQFCEEIEHTGGANKATPRAHGASYVDDTLLMGIS